MSILDLNLFTDDRIIPDNDSFEVFLSKGRQFSIIIYSIDEDDIKEFPHLNTLQEFSLSISHDIDDNFYLKRCDLLDFIKDYYIIDYHNDLYILINIDKWNCASLLEKWQLWLLHGYPFTYSVNQSVTYNIDYMFNNITSDEEIERIIYDKDNIHKSLRRCNDFTGTIGFRIVS